MPELTKIQKEALKVFAKSSLRDKFYWTGGTLLAFRFLRHRQSDDLDFFSEKPFRADELNEYAETLRKELKLDNLDRNRIYDREELFLSNKENLKMEFVFYEQKKLKPKKKWRDIYIDSFEDIATNKLMAFFDRSSPKDLIDLYFILSRNKFKLKTLIKWGGEKFGLRITESTFWSEAIKHLKDLDKIKPLLLGNEETRNRTIKRAKEYFESKSSDFLYRVLDK